MTDAKTRLSIEEYGLELADAASRRSEDLFFQVGAVILRADKTVASIGYNGAPSGVEIDWQNRERRRGYVIHAELNALRYVTPDEISGGLIACTHHPCAGCLRMIAAYGLTKIVYRHEIDWSVYNKELCDKLIETCRLEVIHA